MSSPWWVRWARRLPGVGRRSGPGPAARAARPLGDPAGVVLSGTVWVGGDAVPDTGFVVLDAAGQVVDVRVGPEAAAAGRPPLPVLPVAWVGPAPVDAHLAGRALDPAWTAAARAAGVARARAVPDEGAPARPDAAARPDVVVPARLVTAARGDGDSDVLRWHVRQLVRRGVTVASVDLTAGPDAVALAVRAAHDEGLPVVADAPRVDLVHRALDAGVDELVRTPVERLPDDLVDRLAASGTAVTSTLQTFFSEGRGRDAAANAAALVRAGVPLRYGTGSWAASGPSRPGVDPRELDRLAAAGLGRLGALRAATDPGVAGLTGYRGRLAAGGDADLVALAADPLVEPWAWHAPLLVVVRGRVVGGRADHLTRSDAA